MDAVWHSVFSSRVGPGRTLCSGSSTVALSDLATRSALAAPLERLQSRSVLVCTNDQLVAAVALVELQGVARRLVLCPPDLDARHLPYVVATAEIDAIVTDRERAAFDGLGVELIVSCSSDVCHGGVQRSFAHDTEWILFTSGTTGVPKMVVHSLATLTGAIESAGSLSGPVAWATFYDIRRYGGLQILLRAVLGGGSLLLSQPEESATSFLERVKEHGVTHITGTPSHWRRALMSPAAHTLAPVYARLSGEIADQGIIDRLRAAFPQAKVAHAFASTEAGVAFEVTDGRAGFPASLLAPNGSGVDLRIEDDTLRVRSARTARRYLGETSAALFDADGFVDTGDVLERHGDRYYFAGRREGIINVGGLKLHPEEVEAVINRHPGVRMSLVTGRRSPIMGAIVTADVVLVSDGQSERAVSSDATMKDEILRACRSHLPSHKVPATIRFVPSLPVTPSGKLARNHG